MGLFGPSKREIAEAVTEALAATLPAAISDAVSAIKIEPVFNVTHNPSDYEALAEAVSSALPDAIAAGLPAAFEIKSPEMRPARGWELITGEMLGKELPVRPHALWANGPLSVTLVDDTGSEEVFTVRVGGHGIQASPVQINKIEAEPGVTLLALYP